MSYYMGGALTDEEAAAFEAKYNKFAERSCLMCGEKFISRGFYNRRCPICTAKNTKYEENNNFREIHTYKTHFVSGRTTPAFRGELG